MNECVTELNGKIYAILSIFILFYSIRGDMVKGLVSIIVPVYNVEKYLERTLKCIQNQTFENWECLIIIDGSPDNSLEVARSFVKRTQDQRFKILYQTNRGLAGARNTGINNSQGEFIAFLDADDLWNQEKLQLHIKHLNKDPQIGVSFSRSSFIDDNDKFLGIHQMPKIKNITPSITLLRNPIGNGSSPVIRRSCLDAIAFVPPNIDHICYFDEDFRRTEDMDCWLRIILTTDYITEGIPQSLTYYRVNDSSLSSDIQKQQQALEQVIEKTRSYASSFIAEYECLARAYQLRYLARRAVKNGKAAEACSYIFKALRQDYRIFTQEPYHTVIIIAASLLLAGIPISLFRSLERLGMKYIGAIQSYQISKGY